MNTEEEEVSARAALNRSYVIETQTNAIRTLLELGGFKPDDVVRAVTQGDLSLLIKENQPA